MHCSREPCLDLSSGSRFRLGTSLKCTLPNSFCWKILLIPTEFSTDLGSLCWASDLSQRAWQTLCCVLGSDPAPAGEAWLVHGMVPLSAPVETLLSLLLPRGVGTRQGWMFASLSKGGCVAGCALCFPLPFQTFSLLTLAEIQAVGKAICIKKRGSLFKPVILFHGSKIMILLFHCFMESICLLTTLAAIGT